jgi:cytoskeletal protein RodZ
MVTDVRPKENFADVRPNGDSFTEDRLSPPAEEAFLAPEPSRGKLIAGTAIVAALGAAVLAYFFLASPGAKPPAETAQTVPVASSSTGAESSSSTRVESSSETEVQPAPTVVDVPASPAAEASPQVAASAVTPQTSSTAQNPDVVFLLHPGVNIRSGPSGNAPVIGTGPRGTQFKATGREGDWVQVENTRLKGWINSQFLAPNKPE